MRVYGLPIIALQALFGLDGSVSFFEVKLVSVAFTVLAFLGAFLFFGRMFKSVWIGLLGATIYLAAPVVSGQGAYSTLRLGFALLPLYLLIDVKLLNLTGGSWRRAVLIVLAVIGMRTFSLLCDGYSFVMSTGIALGYFSVMSLSKGQAMEAVRAIAIYLLACGVAYASYFLLVPGGEGGLGVMPIDFFRGQGVDLYTVLFPSPLHWVYSESGLAWNIPVAAAYGDGSNIAFNFAGYVALASVAVVLLLAATGKICLPRMAWALALSAMVAGVLSLGPTLKYHSWDMERAERPVNFSTYLMPAEKGVAPLHTDWLYLKAPGIKNVRVLARWQGVVHFAFVFFILAFVYWLAEKRRYRLAVLLSLLAVAESLPDLQKLYAEGQRQRTEAKAIRDEYLPDLLRLTKPQERTLLLPMHSGADNNHYTAEFFCPHAKLHCYNVAGDKTTEIAKNQWPYPVEQLLGQRNVDFNLRQMFGDGMLDVVVVPLFDLRRLGYGREAGAVDVDAVMTRIGELEKTGHYVTRAGRHFVALRPAPGGADQAGCGLSCWKQWTREESQAVAKGWGPKDMAQGRGFNRQVNGKSAFWVQVAEGADRYLIALGGVLLQTSGAGEAGIVSAQLQPAEEAALRPGTQYNVELVDPVGKKRLLLGKFVVNPAPENRK